MVLANFFVFNIAKTIMGWETFGDSVKFTWDSTFVDAQGPRDTIEIKPKSNTDEHDKFYVQLSWAQKKFYNCGDRFSRTEAHVIYV